MLLYGAALRVQHLTGSDGFHAEVAGAWTTVRGRSVLGFMPFEQEEHMNFDRFGLAAVALVSGLGLGVLAMASTADAKPKKAAASAKFAHCVAPVHFAVSSREISTELRAKLIKAVGPEAVASLERKVDASVVVMNQEQYFEAWMHYANCLQHTEAGSLDKYLASRDSAEATATEVVAVKDEVDKLKEALSQLAKDGKVSVESFTMPVGSNVRQDIGAHKFCFVSNVVKTNEGFVACGVKGEPGKPWFMFGGKTKKKGSSENACVVTCVD